MARNLDAYEYGNVPIVPLNLPEGPIKAIWQRIWDSLQAKPRITLDDLGGELTKDLPMAIQRVISETIGLYSDLPRLRDPKLRKAYRGRLTPGCVISESAAFALASAPKDATPLTFNETVLSKKAGFPDPAEAAARFFLLVYKRVAKTRKRRRSHGS